MEYLCFCLPRVKFPVDAKIENEMHNLKPNCRVNKSSQDNDVDRRKIYNLMNNRKIVNGSAVIPLKL